MLKDSQLYDDSKLSPEKLKEVAFRRKKTIQVLWNRDEALDKFLRNNENKTFSGLEIIEKMNKLAEEFPIMPENLV